MLNSHSDVLAALHHPALSVPSPAATMAWFRSSVVRFSEGTVHSRRRSLVEQLLASIDPAALLALATDRTRQLAGHSMEEIAHDVPAYVLGVSLGLPALPAPALPAPALPALPVGAVATVAAAYHSGDPAADTALGELVTAFGGELSELTAARISLLVQSYAATANLILGRASLVTRRVAAETVHIGESVIQPGEIVQLDLAASGLLFGSGAHACPGRAHAEAIAAGVQAAL